MAEIQVLDKNTIDQIAAGEVVERPASIVKELVENAIDAQSTAVTVEIKGGGIDFIRITDNGSGIEKDQVRKAFMRHATSKIKSADDLLTVSSLGFRGEALSSIAAVAKVELISKTDLGISGVRYVIEGGEEQSMEELGCPEGTTFVVRNLFYNTPARRKFLKSKMTEAGYVENFMQRLAISHPDISFKFINDGKNKIATAGNGRLKDVIYNIFGRDIAKNLLEVNHTESGVAVKGYIGKPAISRGNRNYENYFVNGRYLKNTIITKAIEEGYKGHAMVHKFPFSVLMITMDPHLVDVNVHPAKMEMRFQNGEELYMALVNAVRGAFVKKDLIPQVGIGKEKRSKQKVASIPEPFEKKRRKIEEHFANLPKEKIAELERRKAEDTSQDSEEEKETKASAKEMIEERLKRLGLGQKPAGKNVADIDQAIPHEGRQAPAAVYQAEHHEDGKAAAVHEPEGYEARRTPSAVHEPGDYEAKRTLSAVHEPDRYGKHGSQNMASDEKTETEKAPVISGTQVTMKDVPLLSEAAKSRYHIVGQVFKTYWVVEFEDKMYFVDQHAAHEKVMYEKFKKDLENRSIDQQMVAPPIILTLTIKEREKLERYMEAFGRLGYQIEEFGGDSYAIRAVPANLLDMDQQDLFVEILDESMESAGHMNLDVLTDRLATMACKAAVKGNTKLSIQEMEALMEQLMTLENPYQCPHGRPTIIEMTKYELEKKFKRVQ